jgi:hypothetical protein
MMARKQTFLGVLLLVFYWNGTVSAQTRADIKFGKITASDFVVNSPVVDSNANAVVLSDLGNTSFEGNSQGWFTMIYKRHKRIKIINAKGFDAGAVSIFLYSNGTESEKLDDLKVATYNLENGAVVTTKLDRKDIFEEKVKKSTRKKFTFPVLKAGSIIEYAYTIKSEFLFNMQPWEFQGAYPCLLSEYRVALPEFIVYNSFIQGYLSLSTNRSASPRPVSFNVRQPASYPRPEQSFLVTSYVNNFSWVLTDVPALKEESFTSSINNHIAKIEFQLSKYIFPESTEEVMATWPKVAEKMLQREDFGKAYLDINSWLDDDLAKLTKGATTYAEKAQKIYAFVRDNFTCSSSYGTDISDGNSLRNVFNKKAGTVSELNLLLLAMLRHENISAEPVLLSLRNRGLVHHAYPVLEKFNYLICRLDIESKIVYLDASRPRLGFGKLDPSVYNGLAWVITAAPYSVNFSSDSLQETKQSRVTIVNNPNGGMDGYFSSVLGDNESYNLREKMSGMKEEDYAKEIGKALGEDIRIGSLHLDSLKSLDAPVRVNYDFKMGLNDQGIIYFSPLLNEAMKKNPFTAAARVYPVEMPYVFDERFVMDMEIPRGYKVDELPPAVQEKLNYRQGLFECSFSVTGQKIHMQCRMMIAKANFPSGNYKDLREFFSLAIKKQSEQIVFKKIKS